MSEVNEALEGLLKLMDDKEIALAALNYAMLESDASKKLLKCNHVSVGTSIMVPFRYAEDK